MVMNLNSIRRWCFISKNDVRWTVFLTILCVWCTVCGGVSSPTTTAPTTPVSQTASEVCIIKTKASIATAMTPKQNQKCTAVTFTTTPPTTTDSTSVASSITNEASTEYPTTATVSNTMSSSMATGTESSITTDLTANAAPTTTPPSSTTTNEEATNTAVTPTTTLTSLPTTTATNAAPTTTAQSSTTEASTTTAVNLKTMPIFPEPTTAPPATENIASTEKPSSTITSEAYTTTDVTPTTTLISSEPTTVPPATENAVPTTALSSRTTTISQSITPLFTTTTKPPTATTFVTPTTMPMFSEITTFLTTTSLQNATQISVTHNPDPTAFEAQSTISLATTATSAPTLIIVTQETTMSLSMSTTDASPTTIVNPLTESGAATTQTTAVVNSTLVFNSSSPVPNEALVLSAINTLRQRRESQLNDSVKVVNVTYQKISETSYAVVFTFNLNNISMPVNSDLRGDTYQKVQNTTNNALNTLLNDPGKQLFVPKTSNFTSTSNQIDGSMGYTFQDEDVIQPVSFLNELRSQMELTTTTVSPSTISSFPSTSPSPISGSAVVTSKLLFNSSSPVPSEALVLSAINTLRQRRESQLNDSVKVVNVTYQKISETSYAVIFTFNLNNISMPVNSDLRGDTYQKVQNTTNNALNTLLNDPGKQLFVPKTSNFTSTSNQIDGSMGYTFQDEDVIQPVSFLNELRSQMELTTTTVSPSTISSFPSTSPSPISGSAVVTSKLLFNSSSPVPSEALVLSAINTLRQRRESQLNDSVKVVNVTYQKISETSYAVIFTFNLNNISMPVNSDLRGDTYQKVQNKTNNALNTLLNDPGKQVFVPKTSNFTSTSNQIDGSMGYTFQAEDVIQPFSFLNELGSQTVLTTASPLTTSTTSPPTVRMRRVYINIQLMFKTVGPIPSENDILQLVNSLIDPRFRTKLLSTKLSDVRFANVTFIRINDTSYSLKFGFEISNISMSEKIELRNETYVSIQTTINKLLTEILNDPSAPQFDIKQVDFNDNNTVIQANVTYVFSESNINTNSTFVKEILKINGVLTTASPLTISTSPPSLFRKVIIRISLVFKTRGTLPSESTVLQVANSLLIGLKLRTKRALTEKDLNDLVSSVNVTYTKIDDASFSLNFGFEISNVSMSEKLDLRNETYTVIENYINTFVSKILNKTTTTQFNFNNIIFNDNSSVIEANVVYVFSDSDINNFGLVSIFLATPAPTTAYPTVLNTTVPNNSTNAAWVVAIIVPVAIVLGLIPCWILLCCLLCGCCAAIRRRWHRRQSYNMQYTTRNSLF
ncbi:uncharacterized protein LOC127511093 isoform X1 [Ctenopharyngodon idella]|uniref:uncharacterized protein LOC127511093 isoform X1 n=1 Tax=Ctenopharyngodon idella TaxID=7959 RepID=UPI0022318E51|nr:uncharacterized protein LOC127511093 isoform X1 [Ctenopharyngodon idella]